MRFRNNMMKTSIAVTLLAFMLVLVEEVKSAELLPGDFRKLDPESCIPDEWVIKGNKWQALIKKCENGQTAITLRNNGRTHDWLQIKYSLPLKPSWEKLVLRGTVRISGLVVGDAKWKTACIMPRFYNSDKKFIKNYQGILWHKNGLYRNFSRTIKIPDGASSISIDAGFMGCNGIMDISNLSLSVAEQGKAYSNAAFPKDKGELVPGNFAVMKVGTLPAGWKTKYKILQVHAHKLKNGKSVLLLNNGGKTPDWRTIQYTIKLAPVWQKLLLTGKVTIRDLKRGSQKWNVPCIMPGYVDAKGKPIKNYEGVSWYRNGTYNFRRVMTIPSKAAKLTLTAGFYGGNGIAEFEKISLKVLKKKSKCNFKATEKIIPRVKQESKYREKMPLNGVWKFKPLFKNRKTKYGYIRVPGAWATTHRWLKPPFDSVPDPAPGSGWDVSELKRCYDAMYEKTLTVPENWKGKQIILALDRVCSQAKVLVDGKDTGVINWPYGSVDISGAVTPGKPFILRLLVKTRPRNATIDDFTFYKARSGKNDIYNRGLAGPVSLTAVNRGPNIDGMFIKTSVRKKMMDVDVELSNDRFSGKANFSFIIREYPSEKIVKAKHFNRDIKSTKKITVENFKFGWENPKLWDIDQPNLYTLEVCLKSANGNDSLKERFGFREIRQVGRRFLLNEKPVRFRIYMQDIRLGGTKEVLRHAFKVKKAAGFNITEICMNPRFEQHGSIGFRKETADVCDEMGFCLMMPTIDFDKLAYRQCISDKMAESWTKEFKKDWKRFRNNPSIVSIVAGFNRFDTNIQRSPLYIGNRERLRLMSGDCKALIDSGNKIIDTMNQIDPTRPASSHSGSGVGNFHTSNLYLNFIPLQERETWLSQYAAKGDIPYCVVEFGTPLSYSFMRGRESPPAAITSEPMLTEWCAVYLGDKAFSKEGEEYRQSITNIWKRPKYYATWSMPKIATNRNACKVIDLFVRNTWRSWRTVGVDGGMVPWGHAGGWNYPSSKVKHELKIKRNTGSTPIVQEVIERIYNSFALKYANRVGRTLVAHNQPYLAYIAGKKDDYTSKDHHFFSGGKVEKQIAVINDSRKNAAYSFTCTVKLDGKDITEKCIGKNNLYTGSCAVGDTKMLPVYFKLPKTAKDAKGVLTLKGNIADMKFSDNFNFTVFPPQKMHMAVMVYDITGKTASYVSALGFKVEKQSRIPDSSEKILIVGENNMWTADFPWKQLERFVKNGGKVLLMTDKKEVFASRFGFRLAAHVARRVFPVPSLRKKKLGNIPTEQMRDWTGAALIAPKTYGTEGAQYQFKSHKYGFHWGNLGSVSSVPLEKPHASGWTPLFETEFALAYSPLMELRLGKGLIWLTTFDFVSRTKRDSGAEKLFTVIIEELADAKVNPERKALLAGASAKERSLLRKMTLAFTEDQNIPDNINTLLIAGSKFDINTPGFRRFISNGGHAIVLPRNVGSSLPGFRVVEKNVNVNAKVPCWPVLRGVSLSDLYLKTDLKTAVLVPVSKNAQITANGLIGRFSEGKGEAVFVQLLPYMIMSGNKDYRRLPAWRWTRLFSQVLANSGAVFGVDKDFLSKNVEDRVPSRIKLDQGWRAEFERKVPKVKKFANRLKDKGNKGEKRGWHLPDKKLPNWQDIRVGNSYQSQNSYFGGKNGVLWYRKDVVVPKEWKGKKVILQLGIVDDMDITYFNGHKIGTTNARVPKHWSVKRKYPVTPAYINYGGKNTIAVRCFDNWSNGGIMDIPRLIIGNKGAGNYHLYCDDYDEGKNGDDVYQYCNW